MQEKAKDAMAVLDAAQKSRESRAQQLNKAQQQMESLAAHKKRLTSQLKNVSLLTDLLGSELHMRFCRYFRVSMTASRILLSD